MPHLSWNEVRDRAIGFSREHAGDRSENAEKQTFWNEFFNVFGLRRASLASFEENVRNIKGNQGAIDLLWKGRLLVEHKSFGEDLALAQTQAFTYIEDLTREDRWEEIPRYVLVSDFARFVLYDLEPDDQRDLPLFTQRKPTPYHFTLAEFPHHIRAFAFMLGQTRVRYEAEPEANQRAYDRMCRLHDTLKAGGFAGHELERLLVRILFCMFAEDTLIFEPEVFTRFIRTQTREDGADLAARLNELFDWLNRPEADDRREDTDAFFGFRYVNGGLFTERLGFPRFNREMRVALLDCCDFQWARISPAVFGSLFQGVMEDRARRQAGAHYTSERDIMKVLHSLFLDELQAEWKRLCADRSTRRQPGLEAFHQRLRALQFLDPACGCGNFLVLAYRELRALEIEVVRELVAGTGGQQLLPIVNVDQFHGIEYFEWPVRIAEVALWLMDHQMNRQAGEVFGQALDRLPLTYSPHIVQGNALRIDWNAVLPSVNCSYVLGNPPFVGKKEQNGEQKADMELVWGDLKGAGVLDYVSAWYAKAARYLEGTRIPVAFVSTNSITQGEQVGILWGELLGRWRLHVHFAHRTFEWTSEARGKAHVHVVIIGFANYPRQRCPLFDYEEIKGEPTRVEVLRINPYLVAAPDILLGNRRRPLNGAPDVNYGSFALDDGHYTLSAAERSELLQECPDAAEFVRPFIGGRELIHGEERFCLWLADAEPGQIRRMPPVLKRVEAVKRWRSSRSRETTIGLATTPALFAEMRQPKTKYLAFPTLSSVRRRYIPIAYLAPTVIASNQIYVIAEANDWTFGILNSEMHMAWLRIVGGRFKSDYRYSAGIVYNNFPWPNPRPEQRKRVEEKAGIVLAARRPHLPPRGLGTLADLYDANTMPRDLVRAHAELDRAVEKCYRAEHFHSDRERVEHLFSLYEKLTAPLLPATPKSRGMKAKADATRPSPSLRKRTPGLPGQAD